MSCTQKFPAIRLCVLVTLAVMILCMSGASGKTNSTGPYNLLNAYGAPLFALTSPGNYYFLEFPLEEGNGDGGVSPMCGDGTPFSFAFRRGTDQHLHKLLIEVEGGPACWGQDSSDDGTCCSDSAILQTPWYGLHSQQEEDATFDLFPRLDSCSGISKGFAQMGTSALFRGNNIIGDVPIAVRDGGADMWSEVLGGDYSNTNDWSYILIPHCTLDWHLGHRDDVQSWQCHGESLPGDANSTLSTSSKSIYHRGGTNLEAVMDWIQAQFPDGLDALVVASGGAVGGCSKAAHASSVAASIVASRLSTKNAPSSDSLVVIEGSALFDPELPSSDDLVIQWNALNIPEGNNLTEGVHEWIRSSPESLHIAWLASAGGVAGEDEQTLLRNLEEYKEGSFHVLQAPLSSNRDFCPVYAYPKDASSGILATFLHPVVQDLSWNDEITQNDDMKSEETSNEDSRLSFFSVLLITVGLAALVWAINYTINYLRVQQGRPETKSLSDLWFIALTRFPLIFLMVSVLIPMSLSFAAYAHSGYQVPMNLDFDSYLQINTPLENMRRVYDKSRGQQHESMIIEAENCELLSMTAVQPTFPDMRLLLDDKSFSLELNENFDLNDLSPYERELYTGNILYASGGEAISVMYQNRNGGNVFEPDVLRDIFAFEQAIYKFPGFGSFCFGFGPGRCIPIDSLVTQFFPQGYLVNDIDSVVRSFLGNQPALWKLDQNFGPNNLRSEVIRSFIFLKDVGGDQRAAQPFLESLYRDYFWKTDLQGTYASMVHTWDNEYLKAVEANDALSHDALWSVGSLCFIAVMIFLKVRSIFVVSLSMLGLVLAFSASYFWISVHFAIESATLLWVAGLYVMLGIGADDIFLMVDSFEHTKLEIEVNQIDQVGKAEDKDGKETQLEILREQLEILRERMTRAYRKAGSMMLVSSVTTAICFFSNAFGILVVIQEFGIFMGMVVLVNFFHVMTILPSAILVNEFYVLPLQNRIGHWFEKTFKRQSSKETLRDAIICTGHQTETIDIQCGGVEARSLFENTPKMSQMDNWLVSRFSPFINRRAMMALLCTLALSVVLGSLGIAKFAMSDGNIVLFTEKYNLGRLAVVTDQYFNKDIKKTIEENPETETATPPPTSEASTPIQSGGTGNDSTLEAGASFPESATQGGYSNNSSDGIGITGESSGEPPSENSLNNPISQDSDTYFENPAPLPTSDGDVPAQTPASGSAGSSEIGGFTSGSSSESTNGSGGSGLSSDSGGTDKGQAPQPAPRPVFDQSATSAPVSLGPLAPNSGLDLRRRETISVNLIWGMDSEEQTKKLWKVPQRKDTFSPEFGDKKGKHSSFDPSLPQNQEALLKAVQMARADESLNVQPDKTTWIEMLRDFAVDNKIGFPLSHYLFIGYVEQLKQRNDNFAQLVSNEIGTQSPGLAGDFTFVSITLEVDAVQSDSLSLSESVYRDWTAFAKRVNDVSPETASDMVAQSRIFLDAYRVEATIDSTVLTWFVANGLCLLIVLLFIRNVALSLMVMGTIVLIFLCLGGVIFAMFKIPFGAVEALGISIFIGLSANYSLHVVHAYYHAKGINRVEKVTEAIFAVGGPIVASALSTMGASAFLFGCRTWVFVELGILVCSITAMALLYSMTFLLAWLALAGPLPLERGGKQLHAWDLRALCYRIVSGSSIPDTRHSTSDQCLDSKRNEMHRKSSEMSGTIDLDE